MKIAATPDKGGRGIMEEWAIRFFGDCFKGLSNNKLSILSGRGWGAAALPIACSERRRGTLGALHRIQPRPPKWTIYCSRVPNFLGRRLCDCRAKSIFPEIPAIPTPTLASIFDRAGTFKTLSKQFSNNARSKGRLLSRP
jgi:hypothetical protein